MTSPDENDFVLRGGDHGAERLRLLATAKWPTTKPLLDRAGLRPGMRCLDMGCGAGGDSDDKGSLAAGGCTIN